MRPLTVVLLLALSSPAVTAAWSDWGTILVGPADAGPAGVPSTNCLFALCPQVTDAGLTYWSGPLPFDAAGKAFTFDIHASVPAAGTPACLAVQCRSARLMLSSLDGNIRVEHTFTGSLSGTVPTGANQWSIHAPSGVLLRWRFTIPDSAGGEWFPLVDAAERDEAFGSVAAVSLTGGARGGMAASGTGFADGCSRPQLGAPCLAASGTGGSRGHVAVSALGSSEARPAWCLATALGAACAPSVALGGGDVLP